MKEYFSFWILFFGCIHLIASILDNFFFVLFDWNKRILFFCSSSKQTKNKRKPKCATSNNQTAKKSLFFKLMYRLVAGCFILSLFRLFVWKPNNNNLIELILFFQSFAKHYSMFCQKNFSLVRDKNVFFFWKQNSFSISIFSMKKKESISSLFRFVFSKASPFDWKEFFEKQFW